MMSVNLYSALRKKTPLLYYVNLWLWLDFFLPRDAIVSAVYAVVLCLSVCLSVRSICHRVCCELACITYRQQMNQVEFEHYRSNMR